MELVCFKVDGIVRYSEVGVEDFVEFELFFVLEVVIRVYDGVCLVI